VTDSAIKPSPVALEAAILAIRRAGVHLADDLITAVQEDRRQAIQVLLNASPDEVHAAQGYAAALDILTDRLANADKRIADFNARAGANKARNAH
jgi:predicted metal-dependent phosphoesterase TrpH